MQGEQSYIKDEDAAAASSAGWMFQIKWSRVCLCVCFFLASSESQFFECVLGQESSSSLPLPLISPVGSERVMLLPWPFALVLSLHCGC